VSPIATLLRRVPLPGRAAATADPPLVEDQVFDTWLSEVVGSPSGLGWRLGGGVPSALAGRMAKGEHRLLDSPRDELRAARDGERVDGFSGRVAGPPGGTPSERMLQVAAWARALAEVLHERSREGDALVSHRWEGRWTLSPLPTGSAAPHIGILDGPRLWTLESPAGRSLTDIGMEIGEALSTRRFLPIGPDGVQRAEVPAVVALDRRSIRGARHAHRARGLQGPWLAMAIGNRTHQAPPLELLAASRLELDPAELGGLMRRVHVLADALLAALDEDAPRAIARDLTRQYGDLWRPRVSWKDPPRTEGREEYVARSLDGDVHPGGLDAFAYALGVALRDDGDHSPPFRVPHGDRDVLTSVRFDGGQPESFFSFAARLGRQRGREDDGYGLLSEWQRRLGRLPVAVSAQQRVLGILDEATRLDGPAAALTGAAELSYSELTPRRDADFRVYSGTTPPGASHTSAVALHVHRIGSVLDVVLTARGRYAERQVASALLDRILAALPR